MATVRTVQAAIDGNVARRRPNMSDFAACMPQASSSRAHVDPVADAPLD